MKLWIDASAGVFGPRGPNGSLIAPDRPRDGTDRNRGRHSVVGNPIEEGTP